MLRRCDSNCEGRALAILYHHIQRVSIAPVIGAAALILLLDVGTVFSSPAFAKATAFILMNAVFAGVALLKWYQSSLTVELTNDELRWHIGPGPTFRVGRHEISDVRHVHDPWWGGYGTTLLFGTGFFPPKRWTYKVEGDDAVEVRLTRGGWRRLGTDDPQGLLAALKSSVH
jgi:hypothetical protein